MKHVALYKLLFLIFGFIACNNDHLIKPSYRNTFIDDSVLQLYVPKSILDSNKIGQQIFGHYGYALLQHYGYWFLNKKSKGNDMKILFYDGLEKVSAAEGDFDKLLERKVFNIKDYEEMETFISLDTMRIEGRKTGILKNVEGCGDSALLITSCYIACPERNRIYYIHISCDKSETGNMFRDSIPSIIQSISFKD